MKQKTRNKTFLEFIKEHVCCCWSKEHQKNPNHQQQSQIEIPLISKKQSQQLSSKQQLSFKNSEKKPLYVQTLTDPNLNKYSFCQKITDQSNNQQSQQDKLQSTSNNQQTGDMVCQAPPECKTSQVITAHFNEQSARQSISSNQNETQKNQLNDIKQRSNFKSNTYITPQQYEAQQQQIQLQQENCRLSKISSYKFTNSSYNNNFRKSVSSSKSLDISFSISLSSRTRKNSRKSLGKKASEDDNQDKNEIEQNMKQSQLQNQSLFFDCTDDFQFPDSQKIHFENLQMCDLIDNFDKLVQWVQSLNTFPLPLISLSKDILQDIEDIKKETLNEFFNKLDEENQNGDLYDIIIQQDNNYFIKMRSETNYNNQRVFFLMGEWKIKSDSFNYYINTVSQFSLMHDSYGFDQIYKINKDLDNPILYAHSYNAFFDQTVDFVILKHYQLVQTNQTGSNFYGFNNNNQSPLLEKDLNRNSFSPVIKSVNQESLCDIDVSLNCQEFDQGIESIRKKNSIRGGLLRGSVITQELDQSLQQVYLKVNFMEEISYNNQLSTSNAKQLFTYQFNQFFQKLYSSLK